MARMEKVGTVSELPPAGETREFASGATKVCIANMGDRYTAMQSFCPHLGGPLGQGVVENGNVVCPWHGWEFNGITGRCAHRSGWDLRMYKLEISGSDVLVDLEEALTDPNP